jgi:hypothetical protein
MYDKNFINVICCISFTMRTPSQTFHVPQLLFLPQARCCEWDLSHRRTTYPPVPISSWTPKSGFPSSSKPTTPSFSTVTLSQNGNGGGKHDEGNIVADMDADVDTSTNDENESVSPYCCRIAGLAAGVQFVLGAWLWVCGQQIGSFSVMGLGYWIIFDVLGIGLGSFFLF